MRKKRAGELIELSSRELEIWKGDQWHSRPGRTGEVKAERMGQIEELAKALVEEIWSAIDKADKVKRLPIRVWIGSMVKGRMRLWAQWVLCAVHSS
ncbi:hypothetical protein BY996DRAFT_6459701 [Phakopsora pachyrhizi]|nr:hypothetical protein BY996DRAFT_6459701 [Phakopsora pachyrhizi]